MSVREKIFWIEGVKEGQKLEQQRIIKLANDHICFDHHKGCEHSSCYTLSNLVALIKGEQK